MKRVKIETNRGTMLLELFEDDAPGTVENLVGLVTGTKEWTDPRTGEKVRRPYYDGLRFHRVIDGFMIQGGDPFSAHPELRGRWGSGNPGFAIPCETSGKRQKHVRGTLSMAHRGANTGGSQFFICHAPQPHLDGRHTVFGQVIEGLDVIDKISEGDSLVRLTILDA